jgi:hypothetical protein
MTPAPGPLAKVRLAQARLGDAQIRLDEAVFDAKQAGHTWAEIADVFGTSREAAYQRFAPYIRQESAQEKR